MLLKGRRSDFAERDHGDKVHHRQAQSREPATEAEHQQDWQRQLTGRSQGSSDRWGQPWHVVLVVKKRDGGAPVAQLGEPRQKKHLRQIQASQQGGQRLQRVERAGQRVSQVQAALDKAGGIGVHVDAPV